MATRLPHRHIVVVAVGLAVAASGLMSRPLAQSAPPSRASTAPPRSASTAATPARVLRLPTVPYNYTTFELPTHFKSPNAQLFDNTPRDNPLTDGGATLGRVLFYDTRLSGNNTVACGSCHAQARAFADPERASRGFTGGRTDRHAMNLGNLRYHPRGRFFWDERGGNLEEMVLLPIENSLEMGQPITNLPKALAEDRDYPALFNAAFGSPEITKDRIARALAQFVRSLVSYQSKYDTGRAAVQSNAEDFANFTLQENRGKALFMRNCAICHLPNNQEAHFIMTAPANTGLDADPRLSDGGVGDITLNPAELGLFKSPSLRNADVTGPYMHDGRFDTLEAVIDHYSGGGKTHPNKDVRMQPLNFTLSERAALVAFLKTLTDQSFLTDPKFADPFK